MSEHEINSFECPNCGSWEICITDGTRGNDTENGIVYFEVHRFACQDCDEKWLQQMSEDTAGNIEFSTHAMKG